MVKVFFEKLKQNHLLLMVICCALPLVLILGYGLLSKANASNLFWLMILLCPLLHIVMMRGHNQENCCAKAKGTESAMLVKVNKSKK